MTDPRPTRFTVNLDPETDARYERLVAGLIADIGRVPSQTATRGRRHPSRADLLRALLAVAENDPDVLRAVHLQVRRDLLTPLARDEIVTTARELRAGASRLDHPDAEAQIGRYADDLEHLANVLAELPDDVAPRLSRHAFQLQRLAATFGGYEQLRPLLALARQLEAIRDLIDPTDKVTCAGCGQLVRPSDSDTGRAQHCDQAGSVCGAVAGAWA